MTRSPEASLQEVIVTMLRFKARRGVMFFHVPNQDKRSPRTGAQLKRMGMKPGTADLCVIVDQLAHFLELKAKDGRQSKEQRAFELECEQLGIPYRIAKSFNEVEAILSEWGCFREKQAMRKAA